MNARIAYSVIGLLCVALVAFFQLPFLFERQKEPDASNATGSSSKSLTLEGVLLRDGKHLKPGVWYLGFEQDGEKVATELSFTPESVCAGKTRSGICNPSRFIVARSARVEGIEKGEAVQVLMLQFLDTVASTTQARMNR